ncbi:uncharacterized protein [Physcomitrium patens]|uniref:uncharacterized protein isoform X3 n=1 Tax=Physcomitrium patens TaxID=3218 RepID=UPI000D15C906|nr:uncharacterized protein LOC112277946 isoform X3 [Physcomitrium patens]|eukprot:XP_024366597.1 uncharacterized protein LOC112277946 isoform X3 [Physcomitrella patens]
MRGCGLFTLDTQVGQCPVKMASGEDSQRSSSRKAHLFDFCIKFLRISGIRLPIPPHSGDFTGSSSKIRQTYFLKITLLHGTEQQIIGEFEVVGDECIINHQISCQIAYARPDKLHVYIDQNWSAGLSGHITVDFKEVCLSTSFISEVLVSFFEDLDAEICLEYPLFSSGPSHVRSPAKLEMSVLCACSTKSALFSNQLHLNQEYMNFEDLSKIRPSLEDLWYPPDQLNPESGQEALSMLPGSVLKQVTPSNLCLDKVDREIEMLKEMEEQYTRKIPTRPDVVAAAFFAAGMAFQRQVDNIKRHRMYSGTEDPLLPGESPRLLLEDVSSTFKSEAPTNQEVQEVDTFCHGSSRSLVFSENSHSCGLPQSCSCSSEAATSLAGDIDEDENDQSFVDSSVCSGDTSLSLSEPELSSPRTSSDTRSSLGECSTSEGTMNFVRNDILSEPHGRLKKNNVLSVVDSVLGALAIIGSPGSRSKDIHPGGSKDERVTIAGSMLGRQQVTSIQAIRKSNPGLGWLTNSMQFE